MQVGIMQGRLSPARARLQSFPRDTWQAEFERARRYGFDLIEWLFAAADYTENPIWSEAGVAQIRDTIATSGVAVRTVCADYFIDHPLVSVPEREREHHIGVLNVLIRRASELGASLIVVPALEAGEVRDAEGQEAFLRCLAGPMARAGLLGVTLAVESNAPAERYLELIRQAAHPALRICFDTGNRTADGEDILRDIEQLVPHVGVVHVKDRPVGGPNVPLGAGAAPLDRFLPWLARGGYSGPLILETTVADDYAYHAQRNLEFVRTRVSRAGFPAAAIP